VAQQRERAEGEHVGRGVQPGAEQEGAGAGELVVGEVAGGEAAEDVVAGPAARGPHQVEQVRLQGLDGGALLLGRRAHVGQGGDVAPERVAVAVRDAEQLADDEGADRRGELGHQVDRCARALHRVQPIRGDLLHAPREGPHPAHGEAAGQQAPQPRVLGRVDPGEVADRCGRQLGRRARDRHRQAHQFVAGAEPAVREHGAARGVAGGEPAVVPVGIGHAHERVPLEPQRGAIIGATLRSVIGPTVAGPASPR
jgi:hypothetical protein